MTSQPEPNPGEGRTAVQFLRPLRDLAAYALVAAPAIFLLVAVIRLIPGGVGEQFGSRTQDSFDDFVNLPTIFLPLGAVLLALLVKPQHPKANLIVLAAAVEYAVGALFAVIFGILIGLVQMAGFSFRSAFEELLIRIAWLAVFALAGFATYQIWRNLFYTPKPKPQPGMYGQPQYGVPGTYPGQPGYGPLPGYGQPGAASQWGNAPGTGAPGQPAWGQPGAPGQPAPGEQPAPGQPAPGQPGFGQPGFGQPGQPGQPGPGQAAPGQHGFGQPAPGQPAFGQPPVPPAPPAWAQPSSYHPEQPVSAQPASPAAPASAPPATPFAPAPGQPPAPATYGTPSPGQYGTPPQAADFSEPTQAVPRYQPPADETQKVGDDRTQIVGDDRTQIVRDERPGFGPADDDPSRR